ncbi:peptidylprolyl isomerase [Limibacter armeniacum]|uniref:peptidylprolyl isomerase n=1 Tax=Limibacter armeniacum TaxID=466084 RepID=UPI002FE53E22
MKFARIITNKGILNARLFENEVPVTVENFSRLAEQGVYDASHFHKYVEDVLIQAGSPNGKPEGWGGYFLRGEASAKKQRHDTGVLSMACTTTNTMSTQFFIAMSREETYHLDRLCTCFGIVDREDFHILRSLRKGDKIEKIEILGASDRDEAAFRQFTERAQLEEDEEEEYE